MSFTPVKAWPIQAYSCPLYQYYFNLIWDICHLSVRLQMLNNEPSQHNHQWSVVLVIVWRKLKLSSNNADLLQYVVSTENTKGLTFFPTWVLRHPLKATTIIALKRTVFFLLILILDCWLNGKFTVRPLYGCGVNRLNQISSSIIHFKVTYELYDACNSF